MIVTALTVIAAPLPAPEPLAPPGPPGPPGTGTQRSFASLLRQQSRSVAPDSESKKAAAPASTPPASTEPPAAVEPPPLPLANAAVPSRDDAKGAPRSALLGDIVELPAPAYGTDARRAAIGLDDEEAGATSPDAAPGLPTVPLRSLPTEPVARERSGADPGLLAARGTSHAMPSLPAPLDTATSPGGPDAATPSAMKAEATTTPFALAAPGSAAPAPPPVEAATVAAPVGTPAFAEALAVQVSVLVTAGSERAELHLNPADMGPVSVQIVVDGTAARIEFGADVAATRQAIEASLPELASALREAGLTLHGGGVSQHARERHDADTPAGRGRAAGADRAGDDGPLAAAAPRRLALAGGIDLYA